MRINSVGGFQYSKLKDGERQAIFWEKKMTATFKRETYWMYI